jgi:hypothetical protein
VIAFALILSQVMRPGWVGLKPCRSIALGLWACPDIDSSTSTLQFQGIVRLVIDLGKKLARDTLVCNCVTKFCCCAVNGMVSPPRHGRAGILRHYMMAYSGKYPRKY